MMGSKGIDRLDPYATHCFMGDADTISTKHMSVLSGIDDLGKSPHTLTIATGKMPKQPTLSPCQILCKQACFVPRILNFFKIQGWMPFRVSIRRSVERKVDHCQTASTGVKVCKMLSSSCICWRISGVRTNPAIASTSACTSCCNNRRPSPARMDAI